MRAQERPATLILTVTSGLRLTRARHVYYRDAETGNWNFVLQLRTIRMQKMCQSQQFVTWDPSFCHPSVTPAQTFAGRKLKTRRSSMMFSFSLELELGTYIEDITCPRVDMNFIFEWSTRYLTSERSERVRYRVDHEKIKFISISGHVIFCLLYKHQWNTKPFYFNIFNGLKVERVVTKHGRSTWTKTKFIW